MTSRLIGPQCSKGAECHPGWPARAVHTLGLCVHCWRGLTATQRRLLTWEHEAQATEPIDVLENIAALPAFDGRRRWAA